MDLNRYHEQHGEIQAQLQEMHRRLEPGAFAQDPGPARASLVTLAARLNIHLAFEDQALYPSLLRNPSPAVQAKARQYMDEMGGLKERLAALMGRWVSAQRVQQEPQAFRAEAREFLQALERRLQGEDQDFYPLLERLA